jgi:hypothetical protein
VVDVVVEDVAEVPVLVVVELVADAAVIVVHEVEVDEVEEVVVDAEVLMCRLMWLMWWKRVLARLRFS